jgi:hypothetical protein
MQAATPQRYAAAPRRRVAILAIIKRLETDIPMIIWRIEPLILETGQSVMRFEFIPLRQTVFEAPDSPERMRDGDRQFL